MNDLLAMLLSWVPVLVLIGASRPSQHSAACRRQSLASRPKKSRDRRLRDGVELISISWFRTPHVTINLSESTWY